MDVCPSSQQKVASGYNYYSYYDYYYDDDDGIKESSDNSSQGKSTSTEFTTTNDLAEGSTTLAIQTSETHKVEETTMSERFDDPATVTESDLQSTINNILLG